MYMYVAYGSIETNFTALSAFFILLSKCFISNMGLLLAYQVKYLRQISSHV